MTPSFFVVDTNVLVKAALNEGNPNPAGQAACAWLTGFANDDNATLIVDFESRPEDDAVPYFSRQFLPHISIGNARSRILAEYLRNVHARNPWFQVIADKLRTDRCIIVSVDYEGPHAILPKSVASRVDPSDRKFVMAAISYIRHHVMGPRFRPTIVYAADYADWNACAEELDYKYHIRFLALG